MAVPVYVKGGAWTQTEDQILKAAVTKYGLQKWNKIASLISKKTALKCKQRWEEYLNPLLNFQKFTTTEDDKLLELAKYYPNQWRTIADLMGRTAQMCNDRYNHLISKMVSESTDSTLATYDLKVGEVNPNNETLPAKPSLQTQNRDNQKNVDQELIDDEREMIADAKARLMNTQGKKASRKVRERLLDDSKKIALIQKRRELKQAGIHTKLRPPKRGKYDNDIDYNAEVIYEHKPLGGPYDTTEEELKDEASRTLFEKKVDKEGLKRLVNSTSDKRRSDNSDDKSTSKKHKNNKNNANKESLLSRPISGTENAINDFKKPHFILSTSNASSFASESHTAVEGKGKEVEMLLKQLPMPLNDFEIVVDSNKVDDETSVLEKQQREFETYNEERNEKNDLNFYIAETELEIDKAMSLHGSGLQTEPTVTCTYTDKVEAMLQRNIHKPQSQIEELDRQIENKKKQIGNLTQFSNFISAKADEEIDAITKDISLSLRPKVLETSTLYRNNYYQYANNIQAIQLRKQRLQKDIEYATD